MTYKDVRPPITGLREAVATESFHPGPELDTVVGDPDDAMKNAFKVISGEAMSGCQGHMHMETQVSGFSKFRLI